MIESSIACKVCGQVHGTVAPEPGYLAECSRCGSELSRRTPYSLALTTAFALSALFFYFPANALPILRMTMYGRDTDNTILTGVVRFYEEGDYFVAIVVFLTSVMIPFLKILSLLFLVASVHWGARWGQSFRTKIHLAVEALGRWAMLDVFALAVLVSLIKVGRMANVLPGKGGFSFVLVIIFTILASASFDSHLVWNNKGRKV